MSFQAVQKKIAAEPGYNMKDAGAALAASSRNASPAAKKENPNLKKVLMPKKSYPKGEAKAHQGVENFFAKHKLGQ